MLASNKTFQQMFNRKCLADNHKERSLIVQRIIYDWMMANGKDVSNFEITKATIHFTRNARYKEAITKKKKTERKNCVILKNQRNTINTIYLLKN
jgi:hypothetical protein